MDQGTGTSQSHHRDKKIDRNHGKKDKTVIFIERYQKNWFLGRV
jgi:hypothetical protein